mgnify:FL=1
MVFETAYDLTPVYVRNPLPELSRFWSVGQRRLAHDAMIDVVEGLGGAFDVGRVMTGMSQVGKVASRPDGPPPRPGAPAELVEGYIR